MLRPAESQLKENRDMESGVGADVGSGRGDQ